MITTLRNDYFEWMYQLVCDDHYIRRSSYRELCSMLDNLDFEYTIPMDENRYEDGIDLRYRFGYEHELEGSVIATELDYRPCSVLEMMVALALRCEEHIMTNIDTGDRTSKWFRNMLRSLGLYDITDDNFDYRVVKEKIDILLNHDYEPDGRGGLFTIRHANYDMRRAEIWKQAMWYFNEMIPEDY